MQLRRPTQEAVRKTLSVLSIWRGQRVTMARSGVQHPCPPRPPIPLKFSGCRPAMPDGPSVMGYVSACTHSVMCCCLHKISTRKNCACADVCDSTHACASTKQGSAMSREPTRSRAWLALHIAAQSAMIELPPSVSSSGSPRFTQLSV